MKFKFLPLCLVLALLLTACGKKDEQVEPTAEATPSEIVSAEPSAEPEQKNPDAADELAGSVNPLTGLPMDEQSAQARPVAVMLNNQKEAMPQLGVSQADIIYECPAEGGITRMLGVFQSVEAVETIGSIRSTRPYYVELALSHDAILIHAGGSPEAYNKIKEWGLTAFDSVKGPYMGSLMWRDKDRIQNNGSVHSVVTTGETITELLPTYKVRLEHEEGYQYELQFAQDGTPADGKQALSIKVPFSSYKTGVFTYDSETGKYLVEEFGAAYVDGNTDQQVAVTNVLVLKTACSQISGDKKGRLEVELNGGEGWFACGGKIIPIQWSKNGASSQLVYTTQDGEPLTLGAGNSYVNIIPLSSDITVK